jgi:dynein heavy chain, axonemal
MYFDCLCQEVKGYRHLATNLILIAYPFAVQFPLIDLQCGDFIRDLSERAMGLANQIIEKMSSDIRNENERFSPLI